MTPERSTPRCSFFQPRFPRPPCFAAAHSPSLNTDSPVLSTTRSTGPWVGTRSRATSSGCRAPREDRHGESTESRVVGVGGFRDPEHLVRRAPRPHDSASVGVLAPALALPRAPTCSTSVAIRPACGDPSLWSWRHRVLARRSTPVSCPPSSDCEGCARVRRRGSRSGDPRRRPRTASARSSA